MDEGLAIILAALIAGVTAVIAGLVGGWIGGRAATNATRLNVDDAAQARQEARDEARDLRFLDDRRDAVVAFLKATDRIVDGVMDVRIQLTKGEDPRDADWPGLRGLSSEFAVLRLFTPDLADGIGSRYLTALVSYRDAVADWRGARRRSEPGHESEPTTVDRAEGNCLGTRTDLLDAMVEHLGTPRYAAPSTATKTNPPGRSR